MSVITTYDIKSEKDIVSKLESMKAITKGKSFEIPKYTFDENGVGHKDGTQTRYCATLDLSVLWPEDCAEYSKEILEHGIKNVDLSLVNRLDEHCMMEYIRTQMEKPVLPDGRTFGNYSKTRDGKYGYYTRNANFDMTSSEFTEFDDETMKKIRVGAKELASMWKLVTDKYGKVLRRDFTEYEIKKLPLYPVNVSDDGKLITYYRNYAHGLDDAVPAYISKALVDEELGLVVCTECMCDYKGTIKNAVSGPNLAPSRKEQEDALYGAI